MNILNLHNSTAAADTIFMAILSRDCQNRGINDIDIDIGAMIGNR